MALLHTTSRSKTSFQQDVLGLDNDKKAKLLENLWPGQKILVHDMPGGLFDTFFEYIGDELNRAHYSQSKHPQKISVDNVCKLVEALYRYRSSSLEELLSHMEQEFPGFDRKLLSWMIELATRLSLTLRIRCGDGPQSPSTSILDWHRDQSIEQTITERFRPIFKPEERRIRIEQSFTAAFLVNICRVKIRWSNNLADHLDFNSGVLTIYQHKICLIQHSQYTSPIIPLELLNEALQTMNLLFPFGDEATRELLLRENKRSFYGLGNNLQSPPPDLSQFKFWKKEMAELYSLYKDPPRAWSQLFSDSRDKLQFATFWIAATVLILSLISIAFGIVQSIYSIKQYKLALAQACSVANANILLPDFCR